MDNASIAVLLSAHGTIDRVEDIPDFLRKIRRGRPTPPEIEEEVRRRFVAIGGSPMLRTTREVAALLSDRLQVPVLVAMRLWNPTYTEALVEAERLGVQTLISLPLAPQSTFIYHDALKAAMAAYTAEGHTVPQLIEIEPWGEHPALLAAFAETIREALGRFSETERSQVGLILSAHSLPQRVLDLGDPYETLFRALAERVATEAWPASQPVRIAFQSQGMDGGAWLGPDLPTTFRELAATGVQDVIIAPIGFLCDHMETLYDLDIEAQTLAREAGLRRLERAASLNARPLLVAALEAVVRHNWP